jgi:L-ascorbate metabolism protein UlaG (beta-lactamase superfamily)
MEKIEIRNLGVSAVEITSGSRRILVDAFHSLKPPEEIRPRDIILFTHDDDDHFNPQKLPDIRETDITLIGPPTILKPILELNKAKLDQIHILYSKDNQKPSIYNCEGISIKCYHTEHFNHWGALNNSYLLELEDRRIYITGDSLVTENLPSGLGEVDVIICSLVDEGYLKGLEDPRFAYHHNLSYLLSVSSEFKMAKIIGIHLLGFDGAVDAYKMKQLVEAYGFGHIFIPTDPLQIITV